MKKSIIVVAAIAIVFAACTNKTEKTTENNMNTLTFNEKQAAAMTAIACYEAHVDQASLATAINEGFEAGLTANQIKEALSQLYAYTGFPRSLNALGTLQKVIAERDAKGLKTEAGKDASPMASDYDALKQGAEVQTKLSGQPFDYKFCPAEDYYLKAHLFGDIFARDLLTHADRELVTVSALAGLEGVEPQLAAHVRGARNMGLTDAQLLAIPKVLQERVGKMEAHRVAVAIQQLGVSDSVNDHLASDIYIQNYVDLKSSWRRGEPNTAYAQYFIGNSYVSPYDGGMVNVSFEPGCRNNWHIHHKQVQVLVCVYGRGWYQEWGKPAVKLEPGVIIEIPEGVKHWHGAAKDSWMQHLTYHKDVQEGASNELMEQREQSDARIGSAESRQKSSGTQWLEPVDDETYNKVK